MAEFFAMGGYAFFVWTSYAITLIVMLSIFIWPILERKALFKKIVLTQKRQEQLSKRKSL